MYFSGKANDGLLQALRVDLLPDLGAKGDGGVFEGGIEVCFQSLRGGKLDGLDHGGISDCGLFLAAFSIVRRGRLIMCKRVTRVCAPFDPGHFGVFQDRNGCHSIKHAG